MKTRSRKRLSLRSHLLIFLLIAIVPVIAAIGYSLWQSGSTLRAVSRQILQQGAYSVTTAVQGEIRSTSDLLQAFSAADGDMARLLVRHNGVSGERSGRIILISGNDTPATRSGVPQQAVDDARILGEPVVSDLFKIPGTAAHRVAIVVPAPTEADPQRLAAALIPPERLTQAIGRRDARLQNILVALTDGQGRIIARSRDPEKFVGRRAPDWDRLTAMRASEGSFEATTTEGNAIIFAFQRLENTPGWTVVVGEPRKQFDARWLSPLKALIWACGLAIAIALFASFGAARLIMRPIAALVERGRSVVTDDNVASLVVIPDTTVVEFDELRTSIEEAEGALRERAAAERRAAEEIAARERRYRALAEVGALVFWRRERDGQVVAADGWQELTGKPDISAPAEWFDSVFPDDRFAVEEAWRTAAERNDNVDVEFRIKTASGEWHWVRARGAPVRTEDGEITEWTGVLEDVHERREAQARITHMAHHDALTGLPNRVSFADHLARSIEEHRAGKTGGAILCIDLDRFKDVNDTLGHGAGDALLIAVTARIQANVKKGDVVARLGGDEFVILQASGDQPVAASSLAGRLIEKLSEPFDLDGQRAVIGASIGITLIGDGDTSPTLLMQQADMALYRAKEEGRQQFAFFEPGMDARMQERRRQEMDLRRGLVAGEFDLAYQPIFESDDRHLVGFEALLRWNHPSRGTLVPKDFLPLAEEISLIVPLGRSILQQACADAARWPAPLKVAVNISPVQLCKPGFVDMVLQCLEDHALDPARLELEIPEEALIYNPVTAFATLGALKRAGVRIVMDNFGTGASSIGHLRTFRFDKVKIDASFVQGLEVVRESDAIVTAITSLCSTIGIPVAAQGVETERQLQILASHTSLEIQGHLLGRPTDTLSVDAYLRAYAASQASNGQSSVTPINRRSRTRSPTGKVGNKPG